MGKRKPKETVDPLVVQLFPSGLKKGDLKKAQIVQAIVEIVAREGFESLSFDRIGQEVGIAKSHVVYHFHSKNEMILKAFQFVLNHAQNSIIEALLESRPGLDRFQSYVRGHFRWLERKPIQLRFMLLFYGRCTYDLELREFNQTARIAGRDRIRAMLKEDPKISSASHLAAATFLQDLLTGTLIDLLSRFGDPPDSERSLKLKLLLKEVEVYWTSLRKSSRSASG